jgi:ACS family allantoate permease-like MFS transporter
MFVASDAPKYIRGLTACAVLYCVEFCCMAAWRFYCKLVASLSCNGCADYLSDIWENRRRAKIIRAQGISEEESLRLGNLNAEADMTDRENIYFKYKY